MNRNFPSKDHTFNKKDIEIRKLPSKGRPNKVKKIYR
jgi:hypothetical protein